MITYADACRVINESRSEAVAVTTMTQTKYWNQVSGEPDLDVGIANAMSKASSVALGIALGDSERPVICLDSDGSLLMNFGTLATIAGMAPKNLYHFVFNNGIYSITGGQPVPAPDVDPNGPLQIQVSSLDYSSYVGAIGILDSRYGLQKPPSFCGIGFGLTRPGWVPELLDEHDFIGFPSIGEYGHAVATLEIDARHLLGHPTSESFVS